MQQKSMIIGSLFCLMLGVFFCWPSQLIAAVLTTDTVWQGKINLTEDILVPVGVTLTIRPGTTILVSAAESSKTDPEFLSPMNEVIIRGILKVEGSEHYPVTFAAESDGNWAGIYLDGADATLSFCTIRGAETALSIINGTLHTQHADIIDNRYGIVAVGKHSLVVFEAGKITANDYGVLALQDAVVRHSRMTIAGNRKQDYRTVPLTDKPATFSLYAKELLPVNRTYTDQVLLGDTFWSGRIQITGLVRIPQGSRLLISPGTIVEFSRKDTNHDTIGENGLLIQGVLLAKGLPEHPIIFRSAEKNSHMGDWDSVNIMNSDSAQNLIEYCRFEDAYRGLHFHYANVLIVGAEFKNNYRAIQFQESTVEVRRSIFANNKSGLQGRDSHVNLVDNLIANNFQGGNFLRCNLKVTSNKLWGNSREAFRVREGVLFINKNQFVDNRFGLLMADAFFGDVQGNVFARNSEVGLLMKNVDNVIVAGNYLIGNGTTGLNLQDVNSLVHGNLIAFNGERGVGAITFAGQLTGNNLLGNGRFAIEVEGPTDVAAPGNWWGGDDPGHVINDKLDDRTRGRVQFQSPQFEPHLIAWPVAEVISDITWGGGISVVGRLTVNNWVTLTIVPGTKVAFAEGTGLTVSGRLKAIGEAQRKITFTAQSRREAGSWDELLLEHATGSEISQAIIEYATWGVHSHFTNLQMSQTIFRNNYGGMRFRSGPIVVSKSTFTGNTIGVRAYLGTATFTENLITGNEIGIFVREKGSGLSLNQNSIVANSGYNIRVGDFNNEDVHAEQNWWGTLKPQETMYDGRQEEGIGKILYEPFLHAPQPMAGAGDQ